MQGSPVIEPMYSIKEISALWHIGIPKIRKLFRGRPGVLNLSGNPAKPVWRIPVTLVVEVMLERGYTAEQAERILQAAARGE